MAKDHPNGSVNKALVTQLLKALLENKGKMEELTCQCANVPIGLFCNVIRSKSLKKLDVWFNASSDSGGYSQEEQNAIRNAIRSSVSLESLSLVIGPVPFAVSVLTGLKDGAANSMYKLRELSLKCKETIAGHYWVALFEFAHATKHLEHLLIDSERFDTDNNMESFLDCLALPSSIRKLTFRACWIDSEGMQSFKRFMETEREVSPLCEFSFDVAWDSHDEWSGNAFASMFCVKRHGEEKVHGTPPLDPKYGLCT
jgi:hypothetical protein